MSDTRRRWTELLNKVARPVLKALAKERLREVMPVEERRREVSGLEAFGRVMVGVAPWLESGSGEVERGELAGLARRALEVGTDRGSKDFLNFTKGGQPLVDAAFLAHAILRAPKLLWHDLPERVKRNVVAAMISTRAIMPGWCNWLLFSAMVEAFLAMAGEKCDLLRMDYAVRQHEQWYKGDGVYGDGPAFHFDYYNSFVIQPMLLDVLGEMRKLDGRWDFLAGRILARAQRYAVVQERFIGVDGSFPAVGRSLAYRCGAFQLLAQMALAEKLPSELSVGQVRTALTLVMDRTLRAAGTFDEGGWLRIGLCGHQPGLGESYISTGSLYLCTGAFLPLGLGEGNVFWTAAGEKTTSQKVWGGEDLAADHAIEG